MFISDELPLGAYLPHNNRMQSTGAYRYRWFTSALKHIVFTSSEYHPLFRLIQACLQELSQYGSLK
jgi:hypothetical protein